MLTIRATVKLLKKLKLEPDESPISSTGRLGDWYCNFLTVNRQQLLLCVSEKTLLPVVIYAKNQKSLPEHLIHELENSLKDAGIHLEKIVSELSEMKQITFAKTANRQVLGSMNDFKKLLEAVFVPGTTLKDAVKFLADTPCGPLKMSSPLDATIRLFESDPNILEKRPHLRLVKLDH